MKLLCLYEEVAWEAQLFCEDKGHQPTVAVDLDGTLAKDYEAFDKNVISPPRKGARKAMKKLKKWGFTIIIFTVRGNKELIKDWLEEHDIPYDYINENPNQPEDASGKVISDLYIDDRALDGRLPWDELEKIARKRLKKCRTT